MTEELSIEALSEERRELSVKEEKALDHC